MKTFCVVILGILLVVQVKARCHLGWILWRNTCFMFSDFELTWSNAELRCRAMQSSLLEITDADLNTFVKDHLKIAHYKDPVWHHYFIGATDASQEGTWEWIDSMTRLGFTDWGLHQPNAGREENCLALDAVDYFLWHDFKCEDQHRFICAMASR